MNNYDEKIDTLIKSVLWEKADDYEVSDEVKVRIDQKIKEKSDLLLKVATCHDLLYNKTHRRKSNDTEKKELFSLNK